MDDHNYTEEWRVINDKQSVSNLGRVRRLRDGYVYRPARTVNGYYRVTVNGKPIRVHTLVAEAFIGPKPNGKQINHIDGNKANNTVENLEYVTCRENMQHALNLGLKALGEDHGMSKLTESDVQEIRRLYIRGTGRCNRGNSTELAARFSISPSTLLRIVRRETWDHC